MNELRLILNSKITTVASVVVGAISLYVSITSSSTFLQYFTGCYLVLSIISLFVKVVRPLTNVITIMILLQKIFWFTIDLFVNNLITTQ